MKYLELKVFGIRIAYGALQITAGQWSMTVDK